MLEARLRLRRIPLRRLQREFSGDAIDLSFVPPFLRCLQRSALRQAAPSVIELT
jgi:hypothetical protein